MCPGSENKPVVSKASSLYTSVYLPPATVVERSLGLRVVGDEASESAAAAASTTASARAQVSVLVQQRVREW